MNRGKFDYRIVFLSNLKFKKLQNWKKGKKGSRVHIIIIWWVKMRKTPFLIQKIAVIVKHYHYVTIYKIRRTLLLKPLRDSNLLFFLKKGRKKKK